MILGQGNLGKIIIKFKKSFFQSNFIKIEAAASQNGITISNI